MFEAVALAFASILISVSFLGPGLSGDGGFMKGFQDGARNLAVLMDRNLATGTEFFKDGNRKPDWTDQ